MKKLLLATAVAALSVSAAHAAPTVYGKAFLTADVIENDYDVYDLAGNYSGKRDDSHGELNAAGSQIGVRGGEALTANTDLVYQLEYRIRPDSDEQQFRSRDTYLGLSNKQYGTLLAGRLSGIDNMIDYADVSEGGVVGGDDLLLSFNEPRANNAVAYVSPSYNGLQFMGMYAMDENDAKVTNDLAVPVDAEVYGVGFKYEPANQPFHLGATYIGSGEVSALKALGGDKVQDIRVSGDYQVTPALKLGALYQNTDYGFDDNENGATVSASYKTATPWTVYGQADWVDNYLGQADSERTRGIIGGKYAFNSRTNGHVYGAYLKDEKVLNLSDEEIVDGDSYGVGAGIEYKF